MIPIFSSINGASAALCVSDIPFKGPIGAVRVGRVNGEFVANPTHAEREQSDLDLVYVGTENDVIMIEGAANEMPEEEFIKALEFAHGHAREMIRVQKELAAQVGKPKREMPLLEVKPELLEIAYQVAGDRIEAALYTAGQSCAQQGGRSVARGSEGSDARKISRGGQVRDLAGVRLRPEKSLPQQHPGKAEADGRPRLPGSAQDHLRSRRAPTRAWLGHFPARRNAGAGARHSRPDRGSAE